MTTIRRVLPIVGLLVAIVLSMSAPSPGDGVVVALVFGAAPIAALAPNVSARSVAVLGGSMVIAGMATTPGGNIWGPIMAMIGLLILLSGTSERPTIDVRMIGLLILCTVGFAVGMYGALGARSAAHIVLTMIFAVGIAASTWVFAYRRG